MTRMEKEIYLMLHTSLEMREILCMPRRQLDWWVTSTKYLRNESTQRRDSRKARAQVSYSL
ncbi:MAG: hypothetical protein JXR97_07890 [Planctomycetes bacterium]|nr:hypothetical protein [Planctomycetota bacterium]